MSKCTNSRLRFLGAVLVAIVIAGCGGGGSGGGSGTNVSAGGGSSGGTSNGTETSTPCVISVKSGFSGNLDWSGSPVISGDGASSGSGGSSGGDGGSGGGDGGGGAGAGGSLGKVVGGLMIVKDDTGKVLGQAITDANGLVTIHPCDYKGPVQLELQGQPQAKYFDESTGTNQDFPPGNVIRALVPSITSNLAVSAHTNAAYEFYSAVSGDAASSGGDLALTPQFAAVKDAAAKALTARKIDDANRAIFAQLDSHLPKIYRLSSDVAATRLPILLDSQNSQTPNTLVNNDRGQYAATLAGLAKAAAAFRPGDVRPMLTITQHLAADLADGFLDLKRFGQLVAPANAISYTFDSLWLSMTVGAGLTSTIAGDAAMRAKVVPISRSYVRYGDKVSVSFFLSSDGKVQYSYSDERGLEGTRPMLIDEDPNYSRYVELSAYAGRSVALTSDRKFIRLGQNPWKLAPPTANSSITWLDQDERGVIIRDSNGAFWRSEAFNSPTAPWTKLPYPTDYVSVHSGAKEKFFGLSASGAVIEWPLGEAAGSGVTLPISKAIQISNHADHGMVLALTSDKKVYWLNRKEALVAAAGALLRDANGALVYSEPNAPPQEITGLPVGGICWLSGSYLTGCDGSVFKVLANFTSVAYPECRSWATSIRGLAKITFPAGTKIWRVSTQKSPPYKAVLSCNALTTGEVPIFYAESGETFQTVDDQTVTPIGLNAFTPALTSCIPGTDEAAFNIYKCNDPTRAALFYGTFRGSLNENANIACQFTFGPNGVASVDTPTDHMTATFNGDLYDRVAYNRTPDFDPVVGGDQVILTATDNRTGLAAPFIEFYYGLREKRYGATAFFPTSNGGRRNVGCRDTVKIN